MKTAFKICTLIVAVTLVLTAFSGCDFWNDIKSQISGDTEDYTLTKGYTYHDTDDVTKVSLIHSGQINGFKYKLYSDHVEITGYTGAETDIEIPSTIEETPVTEIAKNAFHQSGITSVKIPDTVTEIREAAFYDSKSLLEVTFGKGVLTVGKYAFFGCDKLSSVYLNDGLKVIKEYAFNSCSSIDSIVIPDSVEEIGDHAFYLCRAMFKVFVPENVTKFGEDVFVRCHENFKIYAPINSTAQAYAQDNSILYVECYSYLEESYNSDTNDADVSYDDEHGHGNTTDTTDPAGTTDNTTVNTQESTTAQTTVA